MDDLSTIALVALGGYLLYKLLSAPKVAKFGPSEEVTSTISYLPSTPPSEDYPTPAGYVYDYKSGDYVDVATGQHVAIMID